MSVCDRTHPFLAKIKERFRLNKVGSTKETWHVVLDLTDSGISYRPGDSFGVFPENDSSIVEDILTILGFTGQEEFFDARTQFTYCIRDWLLKKANISSFSSRFIQFLIDQLQNADKKKALSLFLEEGSHEALKHIIATHDVRDMLKLYKEGEIQVENFCKALQPMLPRFYSVASSQAVTPQEVHLLVARVRYEVEGHKRLGVCSHFLCDMAPLHTPCVPVYVQPTKEFLLPEDDTVPVIMIGPGTGVAPFKAFLQERESRGVSSKCVNWLIFGERNRDCDYFYEEYWHTLAQKNMLCIDTAFSRDSEKKFYVQHVLWDKRKKFWQWLQDGAMLYVCGDASQMARDVDLMLLEVVKEGLGQGEDAAKAYIQDLRKKKRYLRDVY